MITYRHILLCSTCKSYHLSDIASQFEARGIEQNMNALLNCGMEDDCANA